PQDKGVQWPLDVLDAQMAEILERVWQFIPDLLVHRLGNADAVRLRQSFQPSRDVNAVAVDVLRFGDHVAEIYPDPQADTLMFCNIEIAPAHAALHLDRAGHRVHDAAELDQHAVAGIFDDAAVVLSKPWVQQLATMRDEAPV